MRFLASCYIYQNISLSIRSVDLAVSPARNLLRDAIFRGRRCPTILQYWTKENQAATKPETIGLLARRFALVVGIGTVHFRQDLNTAEDISAIKRQQLVMDRRFENHRAAAARWV
jgi:hypothetical protein